MTPRVFRARRWWSAGQLLALVAILFALSGIDYSAAEPASKLFAQVVDIPLGPSVSRTDYESVDASARRLYVSNMGGAELLVIDLERNKLVARLEGFPKVTGVLVVPELHKVYASVPGAGIASFLAVALGMTGLSSGNGKIAIYDAQRLQEIARLPGGVFPDGIAYDPRERRIFVSDELGSAVTVIDATYDKELGRIATGGEAGNVRYDPETAKVYVPDQSHNKLVTIDPVRLTVTARYETVGCDHPHGLIVAPGAAIGYVACDGNDRLLTIELSTGKILSSQPLVHDPDVLALDPGLSRLYVASESGNLALFDISTVTKPVSIGEVFVGDDAHAVAVDPLSHRLFLALANVAGRLILRELAPNMR